MKRPNKITLNLSPDYRYGVCAILIPKWVELAYRPNTWRKMKLTIYSGPQKWKPTIEKKAMKYYSEYTKRPGYKERAKKIEEREQRFWDKYWEGKGANHSSGDRK